MKRLISRFGVLLCLSNIVGLQSSQGVTTNVDIINFSFSPQNVGITKGDTVMWTQKDATFHTSTSDNPLWDSGLLNMNDTFSFTFNTTGTFPYDCTVHPFMTGSVVVSGASDVPPTVSITSPANGAVFAPEAMVTISADAADSDGTVTNVEFFDGTVSLGNDSTSPFSITSTFSVAGAHGLSAVATDNMGLMATSAVVTVTVVMVTNTPLAVSLTSPANGASFTVGVPITITAETSDTATVTNVEFFDGTTSLGIDTTVPFSVTTALYGGGVHTLTAVAKDDAGATATSAAITNTGVTVVITNPIVARIPKGNITVELQTIADGMVSPIGMAMPDDGSGRMFVYDQAGLIWVVTSAGRSPVPLLDVRTRLVALNGGYDERGLLGLALHTNFAQNPFLYTYTSEPYSGAADFESGLGASNNCQSVLTEWRISASDSNKVDVSTRREILRLDKPQSNHNSGATHFGPDGLLYFTVGDGGQANDVGPGHVPGGNAQNLNRILGKMLRIDIAGTNSANGQYGIPADNPFVGTNAIQEIYAYGLRNPFAFSFDTASGQIYVGDVGQNNVEEIDVIKKGGNYGWNLREGAFWFDPDTGNVVTAPVRPPPADLIDPIADYDHDEGQAVIGGYIDHGTAVPALQGTYVFGDWGLFTSPSGRLFYLDTSSNITELRIGLDDRALSRYLKGFGQDPDGELYLFTTKPLGPTGLAGTMYKIVAPPTSSLGPLGTSSIDGTNFQTSWSGGIGPFALQRKTTLNDAVWSNQRFFTDTNASVPVQGGAGFFRVLDVAHQSTVPLTALLNGENEKPNPVPTAGQGLAMLRLEGNSLMFTIGYSGLGSAATGIQIQGPDSDGQAGAVLLDVSAFNNGPFGTSGSVSGTIVLSEDQLALVLGGITYVNVTSEANPAGEIRGQVAPVLLQAAFSGMAESPALGDLPGHGFGSFTLIGDQLTFNIMYQGLSGAATAAHIHGPAAIGENAGVLIDLSPFNGGAFGTNGTLSGSVTLTPDQLAMVLDGRTYVNVHTPANPNGEIRGQILAQSTAVPLTAAVSGLNERPTPLTNSASGLGLFGLEGNTLAFNIVYNGLTGPATSANINGPADTTTNAAAQIDLLPFNARVVGTNAILSGVTTVTAAQRTMLLRGQAYVEIGTSANPDGEARGQIGTVLMMSAPSGPAERPVAISTAGSAVGLFTLVGSTLDFNVAYTGLSGPATGAQIHAPATTAQVAPALVDFAPFNGGGFGTFGSLTGTTNVTFDLLNNVIDGRAYLEFQTETNAAGEIRGQFSR
jgi:glucose/arabinose dehydrogenase/plastocyanin